MSFSPRIAAFGLATPPGRLNAQQSLAVCEALAPESVDRSKMTLLSRRTGIDSRASVVVSNSGGTQRFYESGGNGPTTAGRMAQYELHAGALAAKACAQALAGSGSDASRISHIVTASCTGFAAPGPDVRIISELGLSPAVRRLHIGFMGCHAAINALHSAAALAASQPGAVVLVCCIELCTLHFHYSGRADHLVCNALFADGAAAMVVRHSDDPALPRLAGFSSVLLPNCGDAMGWLIGNHGFEMKLDASVPETLAAAIPAWVDGQLAAMGLKRSEVGSWAIHPGGPKVVQAIATALDLPAGAIAPSLAVLREHGNMSSATVPFILSRLHEQNAPKPWVSLAFGPGLAGEMMVLH